MDYKKFKKSLLLIIATLSLMSCNNSSEGEHSLEGAALGTTYHIKYFGELPDDDANRGLDSIFDAINKSMSTYQSDSDISKINSGDSTIVVDQNFKEVFNTSNEIYKESRGYFDPTVGNLVNAYGFGPDHTLDSINQVEIDSMLQYVGFNKVKLTSSNKIQKQKPEIFLDFNAIAKGYTIDVIARYFDSKKINNYLIELGGELVAKGFNTAKKNSWVVAIDDPLQQENNRTFQATLELKNRAMATSGNYRKFRVDSNTGQRFVHTINPISGQSEKSNLLSASVLAKNCTLADGYATAFMALGMDRSKEMLDLLENVDVYLIYTEEDGTVKVYTTPGFDKALLKE